MYYDQKIDYLAKYEFRKHEIYHKTIFSMLVELAPFSVQSGWSRDFSQADVLSSSLSGRMLVKFLNVSCFSIHHINPKQF